ncbi:MAG: LytTR family DNA-binding domain-containing protein [Verrucomicrobiota bacterium]
MKWRAIIVDDEALGIERVRIFLETCEDFVICAECDGGARAVEAISEHGPDVVFLDIQMPDLDGFDVLAELRNRGVARPIIVFVTAYNQHAVQAFEVNAVDYLLKPVQRARFEESLERVRQLLTKPDPATWEARLEKMLRQVAPEGNENTFLQRIEIRSQNRTDYVRVNDVHSLEADGNYIEVHTADQTHLARITLARLESELDPALFTRISRSVLINMKQVKSIQPSGRRGHEVLLNSGRSVRLTRPLKELQSRLRGIPDSSV